jgi:ABC-type glycerol-3-phosphate transport system substrate-binding protein
MKELKMNAKRLIHAAVTVLAFSPLAAFAGGGDEASKQWLQSLQSTRSVHEVRAEARAAEEFGQRHPVEVQVAAEPSSRSRAEVKADLAKYGVRSVGA